jgi:SAM-dependent methyltransferase
MSAIASHNTATFRDPAGSLRIEGEEVLRTVNPAYAAEALRFLRSEIAERWTSEGRLVKSRVLAAPEGQPLLLNHPRVRFPSYPWEWTPDQWMAAGELTLDLCDQLLDGGWILKDATPLNILFDGGRPVFVDVLSVERRDPRNPLWLAYGQFARTFLLPLAAYKYLGWPFAATLHRRDGYEPADLYFYLTAVERWSAPLRSLVTIPYLFEKRKNTDNPEPPKLWNRPEIAAAVLRRNIRILRKMLHALEPEPRNSRWSGYPEAADHYGAKDRQQKQSFVRRALTTLGPKYVLDIGANTGDYSRIAAKSGAQVVAWDTDVAACERNWKEAREAGLAIQPLVVDAARPTPAVGWRNGESLSLLDRSYNRFDCVLMLGVVHHLLVADQIPLDGIAKLSADLTRRWLIVEWVPRTDVRFVELCRGRDDLYRWLDEAAFRAIFAKHFDLLDREQLENERVLFLFEKT